MSPYILNLIDLAFTLYALGHGAAELNPLMQSVPLMIAYKVVVVGALCWWLARRREPFARVGLRIAAIAFSAVDLFHIANIAVLWAA